MKKLLILSVVAASMFACSSTGSKVAIKTETDSLSNAIGTIFGTQLKQIFKDEKLNSTIVAQAIAAEYANTDESMANAQAADEFLKNYMTVVLPARKDVKGSKFLDETAKKTGVQKTDSGLLYEIVEVGDSANMPSETDVVVAHYKGTLIDGTEFDSSYSRGEPASFPLNRVIKGWTEGLKLIGKGGKIKLYIPADLAYGKNGQHQLSGEVLIFDVELIDIKKEGAE